MCRRVKFKNALCMNQINHTHKYRQKQTFLDRISGGSSLSSCIRLSITIDTETSLCIRLIILSLSNCIKWTQSQIRNKQRAIKRRNVQWNTRWPPRQDLKSNLQWKYGPDSWYQLTWLIKQVQLLRHFYHFTTWQPTKKQVSTLQVFQ